MVHVQFCDHDDFVHACDVLVGLELRVGTLIVLVVLPADRTAAVLGVYVLWFMGAQLLEHGSLWFHWTGNVDKKNNMYS